MGSGKSMSVKEFAKLVWKATKSKGKLIFSKKIIFDKKIEIKQAICGR